MGKMIAFLLVFVFSAGPLSVWAETPSVEEIVDKVQWEYDRHLDFKASFVQATFLKSLGKKQVAEGTVYFKKPGMMRWTFQKPTKQEIISDGTTLWNYRPEEKQVVVTGAGQAFQSKVPSSFLAGLGNLKRDFQARWAKEPSPEENLVLELTPLEAQGSLEKLFLVIDRRNFRILQARIQDIMGNITEITFSKIQFDNRLSDSLFNFVPPRGVEVFQMPGASPAGQSTK